MNSFACIETEMTELFALPPVLAVVAAVVVSAEVLLSLLSLPQPMTNAPPSASAPHERAVMMRRDMLPPGRSGEGPLTLVQASACTSPLARHHGYDGDEERRVIREASVIEHPPGPARDDAMSEDMVDPLAAEVLEAQRRRIGHVEV